MKTQKSLLTSISMIVFTLMLSAVLSNTFAQMQSMNDVKGAADTMKVHHKKSIDKMKDCKDKMKNCADSIKNCTMKKKCEKMKDGKDKMKCSLDSMKNCPMKKDMKMGSVDVKPFNKICPVSGDPVDPSAGTVEVGGKTVGVCCASCLKKIKNNPEKYMKKLNEDGSKLVK
jgi:hypothetical protein